MKVLVTGSSGHLGEALVRTLREQACEVVGVDILPSPYTTEVGSITERKLVERSVRGVQRVFHTATLHKPHVATHRRQDFVDTNITGTLHLLEAAVAAGVQSFVFTSTTSVFGDALAPLPGAPAVWVTEDVTPIPKNIYGATKASAEDLCQIIQRKHRLPCIVLRTSRFFPEEDDNPRTRESYADANAKVNEYLYRRVDIEDVVSAELLAAERAPEIGFRKYIISAPSPLLQEDLANLRFNALAVVSRRVPGYEESYRRLGWKMLPEIDRVYVATRAQEELGWKPRHDFSQVLARAAAEGEVQSPLARKVGAKGYHAETFADGPYPVD